VESNDIITESIEDSKNQKHNTKVSYVNLQLKDDPTVRYKTKKKRMNMLEMAKEFQARR